LSVHEADSFDRRGTGEFRHGVLKLFLAATILIAGPAAATAQAGPELPQPEDGYFQETVKVAAGVWVLMELKFQVQPIGNVTVIEQSDGLVLVDAGGSPGAGRRIVAMVKAISAKPVTAVIITHWHGDHPQGLSEILKAWPQARTIATRATQGHLRGSRTMNTPAQQDPAADAKFQQQLRAFLAYTRRMGGQATDPLEKAGWTASERLLNQYGLDMLGAVTLSTAEAFDERLDLPDARTPIQALFIGRANTDGDAVVWLPNQKVLIAGDIVVAPLPFGFGSYPADWIETLGRLRACDFEILVPGHGAPQRDRRYLDRLVAALAEIRAKVTPLVAEGLSLDEVRKRVDLAGQARGFVGDDPWLHRWFVEYWITPIVASAYKEAKGEPIVQGLGRD